ncbi:hypothetical protein VTN77DRAFT_9435 [Rasamsonia byssochlamydoides]|uniref:uncharacterized protein n=1 Tax=Rasamsonia byssochlamydoides TaxID=89139 RepID=UPI003742D79F
MSAAWTTPANNFLHQQVYRLGEERGLTAQPPGADRDFLTLTWGPIVFRTTYAPDSDRLFPLFLRALNDEVRKSLPILDGTPDQRAMLERTYASKVFTSSLLYANADQDTVREAFRDWKLSLDLPRMNLPVRLRMCLMVDDACLADFTRVLDTSASVEGQSDFSGCRIIAIESLYPQEQTDFSPGDNPSYRGWTTVTLSSLMEVYTGLQHQRLSAFYQDGRIFKGSEES